MYLLMGGDSELGAATFSYLNLNGHKVQGTTRRLEFVSPERPFFDIAHSLDDWNLPKGIDAACIYLSVPRLRDCAADPTGSARVNITKTLQLIDKLIANGTYVVFLSSNQVFNGEIARVPADAPPCPISEYGRQKAETEAAIRERMSSGAALAILRLSKVLSRDALLIRGWIDMLRSGKSIQAFDDMAVAPVPIDLATAATVALMKQRQPGIYQLAGPRDVSYAEFALHLAGKLKVDPRLVEPVSAYSAGLPQGSTPRNTTLDCTALRKQYAIVVPDVWEVVRPMLEAAKAASAALKFPREAPGAKVLVSNDLSKVAEGVYYSPYPLPLVHADLIAFLKRAASESPLRRARFCAHSSPNAEQHDMLIASQRDTYVAPHRHLSKSETFVVIEGSAELILFDEDGTVEKTVDMGPPASGRPFFYRMPPQQFHSLSIKSDVLVFLENTIGPFRLEDREHASWAPDPWDLAGGRAFIASIVQKANRN
jgi:dTDP-4-dehydrorhamnose reductase